jgi:hypothetical protein
MKRIIVILLMLLAAADLLLAAALSSESGFAGILGPDGAVVSTPGTDTKKVEDKMADALARLDSWKKARAKEKIEPVVGNTDQTELSSRPPLNSTEANSTEANSTEANSTSGNSTLDNNSIISPPGNSPILNSDDQRADAGRIDANDANSPAGRENVGSSSKALFNGYYGMTASRHEMGKSGINSHTFLSGNFEMDKTVKFQDQGID